MIPQIFTEIEILSKISHPNIINYHKCFEDRANIYLLFELAETETLFHKLYSRNKLSEVEVSKVVSFVISDYSKFAQSFGLSSKAKPTYNT